MPRAHVAPSTADLAGTARPPSGRGPIFRAAFYVWTAVLALLWVPLGPFIGAATMRRLAAFWMRGIHRLLRLVVGVRHEVSGLEHLPDGPVIIASKHQSAWETLFFHTVRPDLVIGLKQELRRIPIVGWYLAIAGNIFIDRRGAAKALRSLIEGAKQAVARNCSILIFPEGTRRPIGAPPDYKSGVAALYAALQVPVVPVALCSGHCWAPGPGGLRPGIIRVTFLEAIPPGLDRASFMKRLEAAIETETHALERRAGLRV